MSTRDLVRSAGVIGAGGAGFPTHVKLNTDAEYVLLNGAECEPLLRVDQQLMETHPEAVLEGLLLAKETVGAAHAIIGVKVSHPEVIETLRETIARKSLPVTVGELPDVYPAGDEQVLVYELTGRIVPETGLPSAVGCVVINAETAYNISAAAKGTPVTEKYVTVGGDVPHPVTLRVPVGTPVELLFEAAGCDPETAHALATEDPGTDGSAVVNGGPMMGGLLKPGSNPADRYVTKKTKGLLVLPAEHPLVQKKSKPMAAAKRFNRSACEQCSMCTDLCPRHLLGHSTVPHKMVRAMAYDLPADENVTAAQTCCQCNLCDYFSCPAGIHPRMANLYYMTKLREEGIKHTPKAEFTADPMRPCRQVPSGRLIARLGLRKYNRPAPLTEELLSAGTVALSLQDHVGAPAIPSVSPGEAVKKGQCIADVPEGSLGAPVHASIDGVVERVTDTHIFVRAERR